MMNIMCIVSHSSLYLVPSETRLAKILLKAAFINRLNWSLVPPGALYVKWAAATPLFLFSLSSMPRCHNVMINATIRPSHARFKQTTIQLKSKDKIKYMHKILSEIYEGINASWQQLLYDWACPKTAKTRQFSYKKYGLDTSRKMTPGVELE